MTTTMKLYDGRKVTVEQTMTSLFAQVDGGERKAITSEKYMQLIAAAM